ncbi:hypothetical protein GCM10011375_32640 [Hymenobacter qilianensis]|uniref:Uncharacterized protein n=2 Tax=Hymenobacter qilianensis TaxID=1385715 RepID=A0ACB5PV77_9BACT|nr:HNH endonuclease domain-containing protein [Hymenobacter qilianensis]QNP51453.1 hypothetical protein H9L05_15695 [Hymenobacter qilianensis]GGF75012.1 hypothetical protein GCM10011375_32640 [Hymenobacter qilianensis]
MAFLSGEQVIATILKHDSKTTSYKLALLRALNDVVLLHPELGHQARDVAVPLRHLAELWVGYYWPFTDPAAPIYQGARAVREGVVRNDMSFRLALTRLQQVWQSEGQVGFLPSDGFFLISEMRTPRRRALYSSALLKAYVDAISTVKLAISMPVKHAGVGHWTVFAKPARLLDLLPSIYPLPGTRPEEVCVVVKADLWQAFSRLSLYVEALSLHEWSLFTESVSQVGGTSCARGTAYTLLTARPDNRRPLTWERNQVDVLMLEQVPFTCPWTQKVLSQPDHYDLDHLLPLALYPINELWNLLPVDRAFNQHVKRDRVPSDERLTAASHLLAAAYTNYLRSPGLQRVIREDAALRFPGLPPAAGFALQLARRATQFIEDVAAARFISRF